MNTPQPQYTPPVKPAQKQQANPPPRQTVTYGYCRVCGTVFPTGFRFCPQCRTPFGLRANPDDPTMTTFLP